MPPEHWGNRAFQKNLDVSVDDPKHPQAYPARHPADLMGRLRVRLRAEDNAIVAYGFGKQRIAIPASDVGAVRTVQAYYTGGPVRSQALLVFDHEDQILLRARGLWETYGEVKRVCRAAGVPSPEHVSFSRYATSTSRSATASQRRRARRATRRQRPPLYQKAPGYRRLRTTPRGTTLSMLAAVVAFCVIVGLGGLVGVIPAVVLPDWIGSVRVLIGIVGVALGAAGGIWVFAALTHVVTDGLRWAVASFEAMVPAPPKRFFQRRGNSGKWAGAATAGLILLVPALIGWGPGVAIASGVHGLSDSRLVAELRANGVAAPGFLIDVPDYSTDSNGNTTVTDVSTLEFTAQAQQWQDTDPSIGGRPLPLDPGDPGATHEPVTVVYDPSDPDTAAARRQITGSVWHGAPTANVIVGIIFTLALPLLILSLVVRTRRRRWLRNSKMLDEFVTVG